MTGSIRATGKAGRETALDAQSTVARTHGGSDGVSSGGSLHGSSLRTTAGSVQVEQALGYIGDGHGPHPSSSSERRHVASARRPSVGRRPPRLQVRQIWTRAEWRARLRRVEALGEDRNCRDFALQRVAEEDLASSAAVLVSKLSDQAVDGSLGRRSTGKVTSR